MDTGFSELQIFISLVVVLGTAFVALVVDYLKGNNERLREYNVELRTRREESDRTKPLEAVQWLQNLLAANRPQAVTVPASMARAARPAEPAATPAPPKAAIARAAEPAKAPVPASIRPAPPAGLVAKPNAANRPTAEPQQPALPPARRTLAARRLDPPAAPPPPVAAEPAPELRPAERPSLLESLPKPAWVEQERVSAASKASEPVDQPAEPIAELPPPPVFLEPAPESVSAMVAEMAPPAPPAEIEDRVQRNWQPEPPPVVEPAAEPPAAAAPIEQPAPPVSEAVQPPVVEPPPAPAAEPVPAVAAVVAEEPKRENFWTYRGLLDRVVAEQEGHEPPVSPAAPPQPAAVTVPPPPPPPAVETVRIEKPAADLPPPVKSPLSKWASRLQTNRGLHQRPEQSGSGDSGSRPTPSWVDRALEKEAQRTPEPPLVEPDAAPEPVEVAVEATVAPPEPPPVEAVETPQIALIPVAEAPSVENAIQTRELPFSEALAPLAVEAAEFPAEPPAAVIPEPAPEIPAVVPVEAAVVEPAVDQVVEPVIPEPPDAEPEPAVPAVAPEPEPLRIPPGYHDRSVLTGLMQSSEPINGVLVAIGINEYQHNAETMGRQAMVELMRSVEHMIRGLLREQDFACRSNDDEFILFFPDETGPAAQRRLTAISEKLWNFQLRSLSSFSVLFSWGAVETQGDTISDAVASASERMYQTKRNRKANDPRKKLAVNL